jgi:hypothetical protein
MTQWVGVVSRHRYLTCRLIMHSILHKLPDYLGAHVIKQYLSYVLFQLTNDFHPLAIPPWRSTRDLILHPFLPSNLQSFIYRKFHHIFDLCLAPLNKSSPFFWSRKKISLTSFQDHGHCILQGNSKGGTCEKKSNTGAEVCISMVLAADPCLVTTSIANSSPSQRFLKSQKHLHYGRYLSETAPQICP